MKRNIYKEIFMWILAILPLIAVILVYNKLPEQIPQHWDINGNVSYGEKSSIWFLSSLGIMMMLLFEIIPKIDPKRKNYDKFSAAYDMFRIIMTVFMLGMTLLVLSESLNPGKIRVATAVTAGLGVMFAVIGNMLPKIKNNYFMGIKTPWTLSSTNVWNKTNRLGGILMFIGGIAMIPAAFVLPDLPLFIMVMVFVAVSCVFPAAMSYVWFRKEENDKK